MCLSGVNFNYKYWAKKTSTFIQSLLNFPKIVSLRASPIGLDKQPAGPQKILEAQFCTSIVLSIVQKITLLPKASVEPENKPYLPASAI